MREGWRGMNRECWIKVSSSSSFKFLFLTEGDYGFGHGEWILRAHRREIMQLMIESELRLALLKHEIWKHARY